MRGLSVLLRRTCPRGRSWLPPTHPAPASLRHYRSGACSASPSTKLYDRFPSAAIVRGNIQAAHRRSRVVGHPTRAIVRLQFQSTHRRIGVVDLLAEATVREILLPTYRKSCVTGLPTWFFVSGGMLQPAHRRACVASLAAVVLTRGATNREKRLTPQPVVYTSTSCGCGLYFPTLPPTEMKRDYSTKPCY